VDGQRFDPWVFLLRVAPPGARPLPQWSRQKVDFLYQETTPEAKKGEKGPRVGSLGWELALKFNFILVHQLGKAVACGAAVAKEIGWVRAVA